MFMREGVNKRVREVLAVLDDVRNTFFKDRVKDYPFTEWERKRGVVKERLRRLPDYLREAVVMIHVEEPGAGRPVKMDLYKRTYLFLLVRMLDKSNRGMSELLELFNPLMTESVSYKTIERLYSDEQVRMALHNLFILLLKDEGVSGDCAGDGTGYSLSVTTHYRTGVKKKGKKFIYSFRLIDLKTGMYVSHGYSNKSEKEAYNKAMQYLRENQIKMKTLRLDKYYSTQTTLQEHQNETTLYLIPKKNTKGLNWLKTIKRILLKPIQYLTEYYKRNLNESSNNADKNRFGHKIRQKRPDRQENALNTIAILHNIYTTRKHIN